MNPSAGAFRRLLLALLLCCVAAEPAAARRVLRRFVPADLEFEETGAVALDMAFGYVRGEDGSRLSLPDFEVALGAGRNVEVDLEGEYALARPGDGSSAFSRSAPDNLWTPVKIGLLTDADDAHARMWTLGVQGGPKFPLAPRARGGGFEGVALLGFQSGRNHVVANAGGLVDPAAATGSARPRGFETGLSFDRPLDPGGRWTLGLDLAAVVFLSPDRNQLNASANLTWAATPFLDLYATAIGGMLKGGDRYGFLVGFVPRLHLW